MTAESPSNTRARTHTSEEPATSRRNTAELRFTVYGTSEPGGSKRAFTVKNRAGQVVGTRVVDANPRAGKWKDQLHRDIGKALPDGYQLLRSALSVTFRFFLPRPKGHHGRRGLLPSAPPWPITRPDLLKRARLVEDAMTGLVYADDAQICREYLEKEWGEPERVEISVSVLAAELPKPAAVPAAQLSLESA